jgi:hypothetical protein
MTTASAKRLTQLVVTFALVAMAGFSTPGMAGQAGSNNPILDAMANLQTSVNELQIKVDQLQPAWSQTLPSTERFMLVMPGPCSVGDKPPCFAGVLDKETGLVWERTPLSHFFSGSSRTTSWVLATYSCLNSATMPGNRRGWRLPTAEELASLIVREGTHIGLPAGHPFMAVQLPAGETGTWQYWTATTVVEPDGANSSMAFAYSWTVDFATGKVVSDQKSALHGVWCVRGGQGYNGP